MVSFSENGHKFAYEWCYKRDVSIKYLGSVGEWATFEVSVLWEAQGTFAIQKSYSWNRKRVALDMLADDGWEVVDDD